MNPEKGSLISESIKFYNDLSLASQFAQYSPLDFGQHTPPWYDSEFSSKPLTDLSFQISMHRENVEVMREAAHKYFQKCFVGEFWQSHCFKQPSVSLYKQRSSDERQMNILESLITQNQLLQAQMKNEIHSICKQQKSLTVFLKQINQAFTQAISQELVLVICHILKQKYQRFKQIVDPQPSILPRFNCYEHLDSNFQQLGIQSPVFDQINLEEIVYFSENQIDMLAEKLYYANNRLKILNLQQSADKLKPEVDFVNQFTTLLKQVSKSLFLTLSGATQPAHSHGSLFDIPRDNSFTDFSEVGGSFFKSLGRMPPQLNEDQKYDVLSKKIKRQ